MLKDTDSVLSGDGSEARVSACSLLENVGQMGREDPGIKDLRVLARSLAWVLPVIGCLIAWFLYENDPSWCRQPYVGCLGMVIITGASCFTLGTGASLYAIRSDPMFPRLARALLIINVVGALPCLAVLIIIAS